MHQILTTIPNFVLVNSKTGEIIPEVSVIRSKRVEGFGMIFLDSIEDIVHLDGNSMRVFLLCLKFSTFNNKRPEPNIIYNTLYFKNLVRESCPSMTNSTINTCFCKLAKCGFLFRVGMGAYCLNPKYCFKGAIKNRTKIMDQLIPMMEREDDNSPTSAAHPTGDDIV